MSLAGLRMGGKLGVTSDLLQLYSLYEGNGEKQGDLVTIWPFHPGMSSTDILKIHVPW